ncbi:MAG: hypothetical protein EXQ94_00355 [Alphaproteobacteria bacterium]|nr:hypothetical protein [Alphaproteobacteria bacterium]
MVASSPMLVRLLSLCFISPADRADAQTRVYAVWWSPLLNISSLNSLENELSKPFAETVTLSKDDRAAVADCLDLTRRVDRAIGRSTRRMSSRSAPSPVIATPSPRSRKRSQPEPTICGTSP